MFAYLEDILMDRSRKDKLDSPLDLDIWTAKPILHNYQPGEVKFIGNTVDAQSIFPALKKVQSVVTFLEPSYLYLNICIDDQRHLSKSVARYLSLLCSSSLNSSEKNCPKWFLLLLGLASFQNQRVHN